MPTGAGQVQVSLNQKRLCVTATTAGGTLEWKGERYPLQPNEPLEIKL